MDGPGIAQVRRAVLARAIDPAARRACADAPGARPPSPAKEGTMLHEISIQTASQSELMDVTSRVEEAVRASGVIAGVALLYVPHTTCGLTIQENSDPGVPHDMLLVLRRLAPRRDAAYRHVEDNSASHLQASMMGCSTFVFVEDGRLVLGQWQAIFLAEFDGPRTRRLLVKVRPD
jgi:secondary thiamine-phosphate synthase enzyme